MAKQSSFRPFILHPLAFTLPSAEKAQLYSNMEVLKLQLRLAGREFEVLSGGQYLQADNASPSIIVDGNILGQANGGYFLRPIHEPKIHSVSPGIIAYSHRSSSQK